jgi:exonuclease III
MLGLIWNGRGMGSSDKRKHVRELVEEHGVDFIGIQETQLEVFRDSWLEQLGARQSFYWHAAPSNGRSGGILVGVKSEKFDVLEVEQGLHFVRFYLADKITNFRWNLVIIYGAAQLSEKEIFLREFSILCQKFKGPTLFGGDFNIIRKSCEKSNGGNIGRWSIIFNAIIEDNNLMELHLGNRQFLV